MKAPNALITRSVATLVAIILTTSLSPLTRINAESPPFKVYTTEEGLAHDYVNKIVRDSHGFLWFCTAEGLSRFDGSRFKNFTQNEGLPHRNVNDFFETRDGTLLVGTSAGLAVFDPKGAPYQWNVVDQKLEQTSDATPMFRTFYPEGGNRLRKHIWSIVETEDGTIWAAAGLGLFRVEKVGGELRFEEVVFAKNIEIGYYYFLDDGEGGLLLTSSHGIFRLKDRKLELLDRPGAAAIMRHSDGTIWVGASGEGTGLRVYTFTDGKLTLVNRYTVRDGLISNFFHGAICQLSNGRTFVGLETGLQEFIPNAKPNEPRFRTLNNDIVHSLAEDSAGNLWVGTELKGAWQLLRSGFVSYGEKDGISESEDIRSIYVSRSGDLFLPTRPRNIFHLRKDGKFESVPPMSVTARSWGWNFVDFESIDGEWWVPGGDGLRRYPKVTKFSDLAQTPPKHIYTKKDGLHGNEAFGTFEDSRGDVWITTDGGGGTDTLSKWERSTGRIIPYSASDGLPEGSGAVSYTEDRSGNVWIGFYFGGVARHRGGRFQLYRSADGLAESMPGALFGDSDGRLWVGTSGHGLFRVDHPDAEKPTFVNISSQNGLSSNQIICLTEDQYKQIYVGTGHGINRIDQQGNIEVFTKADGLPSNYITRCAADKNGFLWFVSRSTLVRYAPEPKRSVVPQTVYIDKISVNGIPQKISALGETEISLPNLSPNQNQVQIDFFALTFGAGENVKYQYKLDDQEWSHPTEQQTINLDLTSDKHTFSVRAVREDGVTSEQAALLSLRILPPIWQRWWFVLGIAILVFGAIFVLHKYRTARLREVNAALEDARSAEEKLSRSREERIIELEKVRTRIATDLHDDIGASLTQIAVLSEVAQAHVEKGKGNGGSPEALRKISDVSNELIGTMSDIVWAINPAKDHFSDLTQRMRRIAADLLSPCDIAVHFKSSEEHRQLTIKTNARREVFLIFKESINNIAKHSEAKNVYIDLDISGDLLMLRICDDGHGFDIGPPSFHDTFSSEGPSGNGLRNMRKRALEMNGRFDIDSAAGQGTTTFLTLPLDGSTDVAVEPNTGARG